VWWQLFSKKQALKNRAKPVPEIPQNGMAVLHPLYCKDLASLIFGNLSWH
jgi:hypothetical protein